MRKVCSIACARKLANPLLKRLRSRRKQLVVYTTLSAFMVAAGEALALVQAVGLDSALRPRCACDSPVGPTVRAKRANMEAGRYPPSFKLSLAAKDRRLAVDAADHAGTSRAACSPLTPPTASSCPP